MGCAGNTMAITPNLDQLASSGIRFTHAVSASPVCSPFRATIQSGLYIHEHGVVENGIQLNHDFKTIAEIFSENDYATGYIGKWHLEGFLPEDNVGGYIEPGAARQGWKEWLGYEKSHEFLKVWKYNDRKEKVRLTGYDWEPAWQVGIQRGKVLCNPISTWDYIITTMPGELYGMGNICCHCLIINCFMIFLRTRMN